MVHCFKRYVIKIILSLIPTELTCIAWSALQPTSGFHTERTTPSYHVEQSLGSVHVSAHVTPPVKKPFMLVDWKGPRKRQVCVCVWVFGKRYVYVCDCR
jgi:hypothetical protein